MPRRTLYHPTLPVDQTIEVDRDPSAWERCGWQDTHPDLASAARAEQEAAGDPPADTEDKEQ